MKLFLYGCEIWLVAMTGEQTLRKNVWVQAAGEDIWV